LTEIDTNDLSKHVVGYDEKTQCWKLSFRTHSVEIQNTFAET